VDLAAITAKHFYDGKHKPIYFKLGDEVYLRLYKGYRILAELNKKLGRQRLGRFKVLKRIGKLAYRLDVLAH
jgi:hypothetical protein